MYKKLLISLAVFLGALFGYFPAALAAEHLYNGDMSIVGSTDVLAGIDAKARPDGWFPSGHGDNTRFYVYGESPRHGPDAKVAKVKISRYVNGNASWISQDVPVTGGLTYVLTYDRRSDVPSTLGVRYKIDGVYLFQWLNTFPATNTDLQVPVRRRFTVPAGTTHLAVYAAISSVGYLEVGGFSLVDPADVDALELGNVLRNGSLLEVDKNNEPVGWHHKSSTGLYRGYKWEPCSTKQDVPPPFPIGIGPCPLERGNLISLGSPEGAFMKNDANWYTDEILLPPAKGPDPRNIEIHAFYTAPPDPNSRIRYTMPDGKQFFSNMNRMYPDFETGTWLVIWDLKEVPADAVSFSLFLTRWSGQGDYRSKFSDFTIKFIDPGFPMPGTI